MVKRNIREELKNTSKKQMLQLLGNVVKSTLEYSKLESIIYLTITFIQVFVPIINLFLLQTLINKAIESSIDYRTLIMIVLLSFLSLSLGLLNSLIVKKMDIKIKEGIEFDITNKTTELQIKDFESKDLHNNLSRARNGAFLISFNFKAIIAIISNILSVFSYIFVIALCNPLLILIILPFPIISFYVRYAKLKDNFIKYWELSEVNRKANYYRMVMTRQESLTETKVLNVHHEYASKFKKTFKNMMDKRYKIWKGYAIIDGVLSSVDNVIRNGFFVYLIIQLGTGQILVGNFNTYRTAIFNISSYLDGLGSKTADLIVDLIEIREFFLFMDYDNEYIDGTIMLDKLDSIEFKKVKFKYPSSKVYTLNNVSFKIVRGDKIAFIGENGCGKTTTMKLMLRIYDATLGSILLNGIDIREYNTDSIRDNIAMLMQDFNLFQESVSENIAFKEKTSVKKLKASIPFPELIKAINNLDNKFDTVLGSWFGEGINFSKGQVQKLALSRIFYKNSDCLLLDEPNSALDPRSEKSLFNFMKNKISNKICISTLHVFTNIDIMNRIYMFHKGKIVAVGSHNELYGKSDVYTEYYNL